jgi:hypothetical protein
LPFKSRTARTGAREQLEAADVGTRLEHERVSGVEPGEGRPDEVEAEVDRTGGGRAEE